MCTRNPGVSRVYKIPLLGMVDEKYILDSSSQANTQQGVGEWGSPRCCEGGLPVMGTSLAPNRRLPTVRPAALAQRRPIPKLALPATSLVASMCLIMAKAPNNVTPLVAP